MISSLAMYGGLETIRSKVPMLSGGAAVASACRVMQREESRFAARFFRQISRALALMSTATSLLAGSSCPRAQAMQPLPQQRSRILASIFRPTRISFAASTRTSVSIRGISTSGVTVMGSP